MMNKNKFKVNDVVVITSDSNKLKDCGFVVSYSRFRGKSTKVIDCIFDFVYYYKLEIDGGTRLFKEELLLKGDD